MLCSSWLPLRFGAPVSFKQWTALEICPVCFTDAPLLGSRYSKLGGARRGAQRLLKNLASKNRRTTLLRPKLSPLKFMTNRVDLAAVRH